MGNGQARPRHYTFRCWAFNYDLQELSGTGRSKSELGKGNPGRHFTQAPAIRPGRRTRGIIFPSALERLPNDLSMNLLSFCIFSFPILFHTFTACTTALTLALEGEPAFKSSCTF